MSRWNYLGRVARKRYWIASFATLAISALPTFAQPSPTATKASVDRLIETVDSLLFTREGDPSSHAFLALTQAQSIGYEAGMAHAYFSIAQVYRHVFFDYEKAMLYYNMALPLLEKQSNALAYGRTLIGLAAITHVEKGIGRAKPIYIKAIQALSRGNDYARSIAYELQSYQYAFEQRYDSAKASMQHALELQRSINADPIRIAYTLGALISQSIGNNDLAYVTPFLADLHEIATRYQLRSATAHWHFLTALVHEKNQHSLQALAHYDSCLHLESQLAFPSANSASCYAAAAKCYFANNERVTAHRLIHQALDLTSRRKFKELLVNLYLTDADFFVAEHQADSALYFKTAAITLQKQLIQDGQATIAELETDYHAQLRERENESLRSRLRIQDLFIFSCILIILLTLLLARVLHKSRQRHKQMSLTLAEKNNEIAAQSEEIIAQTEDLARRNQQLESTNDDLRRLDEIGKAISGCLSVNELVDTSYVIINRMMRASIFGIAIQDETSGNLHFPRVIKDGTAQTPFTRMLNDKACLGVWSFVNNTPLLIHDLFQEYPRYLSASLSEVQLREVASSHICCPLVIAERATGILFVKAYEKQAFTQSQFEMIGNIARYISIAVENVKSHDLLRKEQLDLTASNNLKNKLITIITHDLKSPLNSLQGFLALLSAGVLSPAERDELTQRLHAHFTQTMQMVDGILIWTRAQMNGLNLIRSDFNLFQISDKLVKAFSEQAHTKGLVVINQLPPESMAFADVSMIEIVIRNLLANAIKFSNPGGTITLSARDEGNKMVVCVADNGVGIPEETIVLLSHIEQRYTTAGTHNEKGTGLGLYLCREFIAKNEGRLWIESKPGVGSKFFFSLPKPIELGTLKINSTFGQN